MLEYCIYWLIIYSYTCVTLFLHFYLRNLFFCLNIERHSIFLEKHILSSLACVGYCCVTDQNVSILPNFRKINFLAQRIATSVPSDMKKCSSYWSYSCNYFCYGVVKVMSVNWRGVPCAKGLSAFGVLCMFQQTFCALCSSAKCYIVLISGTANIAICTQFVS
jgi:hypothetical protein